MSSLIKVSGLASYDNELGRKSGSLTTANNIIINRNNVAEKRRGMSNYGDALPMSADRVKQLAVYKDRIIRHYNTTLEFDSDGSGTFTAFNGSYTEVESGIRLKYALSNGNFYFTTNDGIKKISADSASEFSTAANYITSTGGPKALDVIGSISPTTGGFLAADQAVAYRIVWGIKDKNNNVILGEPSGRLVITNPAGSTESDVSLTFSVPDDVTTTSYFYQVYRTGVATGASTDPGDDMNLVFEENYDGSSNSITIVEQQPESFRESGTLLYTNPNTGEGIAQSNAKPPIAKDIAKFKTSMFYANTTSVQNTQVTMLGLSGFVSGTSKFLIGNSTSTREYTFVGAAEVTPVTCDTFANTTDAGYIQIYSANDERIYAIWLDKTGSTAAPSVSGAILIPVDISADVSASDVSDAIKTACDANSSFAADFTTADGGGSLTFTAIKNGACTDATVNSMGGSWAIGSITQGDGFNYDTADGGDVLLSSLVSVASSIDETARSLVRAINQDSSGICYAYYLSGPEDLPGIIRLEARNLSDEGFYTSVTGAIGDKFNPTQPESVAGSSIAATGDLITTGSAHGFVVNDLIYAYSTDSTPALLGTYYIKSTPLTTTFTLSETEGGATLDITADSTSDHGIFFKATQVTSNEENPHYLYYSKAEQPESVPIVNFIPIGSKNSPIERIIPLRDALYVLKTEGVFQVTGTDPSNFSSFLYDRTKGITAPDSPGVVNNQIYFLSESGVTRVSDTGTEVVSREIEDNILNVSRSGYNFRTASFGVGYETDRAYMLWLPTTSSDTTGTQSFRYNPFNDTWTRWLTRDNTCGVVTPTTATVNADQLFLGAGDRNYIEKERKNFDRTDYADQEFNIVLAENALDEETKTLSVPSTSNLDIGDSYVQNQYMTLGRFNRLLRMLDIDPTLDDTDYYSTLVMSAGQDSATKLASLVTKVNADDATITYSTPAGTTFLAIANDYNTLVGELNGSTGVFYASYPTIDVSQAVPVEIVIEAIDVTTTTATITNNAELLKGDTIHYKGYHSEVEFAPQHFGDPGILKHTPEMAFIFDQNNFTRGIASFKSDISGDLSEVTFPGKGPEYWGGGSWGRINWGGLGNDDPFRVTVPRNKAKNRYLVCKFGHKNARENFKLLGISIKMRPISSRAYRD